MNSDCFEIFRIAGTWIEKDEKSIGMSLRFISIRHQIERE